MIGGRGCGLKSAVRDVDFGGLLDAVGVEEGSAEVDDFLAAPVHDQTAGVGDVGDVDALEVFLVGLGDEVVDFRAVDTDGHALLRLGNGEFGAVEAIVFFRDCVEVDDEGGGDFADGNGDAAGSEVVADFDFAGEFRVAEQALDFAFGRGVAFLDFGGIFEGGFGVLLGGTGGTAYAIASGAAADEEDHISGSWRAAENVGAGGGGDDGSDFKAFRDIAGVIDLGDLAGGEADLVAVGGVAFGGDLADLFLRELAGEGFGKRGEGISGAGDSHRLIDVGATGEGIADTAAEAGGGAAEGFDFGRVVVGLVFELDEPFLLGS